MALVPVVLVPIEVFGAEDGYGLCDAVQSWSDCNRAFGRIYRVDDPGFAEWRLPGDTITVYVEEDQVEWFKKKWGDGV